MSGKIKQAVLTLAAYYAEEDRLKEEKKRAEAHLRLRSEAFDTVRFKIDDLENRLESGSL